MDFIKAELYEQTHFEIALIGYYKTFIFYENAHQILKFNFHKITENRLIVMDFLDRLGNKVLIH